MLSAKTWESGQGNSAHLTCGLDHAYLLTHAESNTDLKPELGFDLDTYKGLSVMSSVLMPCFHAPGTRSPV